MRALSLFQSFETEMKENLKKYPDDLKNALHAGKKTKRYLYENYERKKESQSLRELDALLQNL